VLSTVADRYGDEGITRATLLDDGTSARSAAWSTEDASDSEERER
jgi:hypothetical protein